MKIILCIFAIMATAMSNVDVVLKEANDKFTAEMFEEVVKSAGEKSVVLSAFSVLSPLAQLALGSVGESHDEILKVIGFPNDNVTKEVFLDVNRKVRDVDGVQLQIANKIYIRNGAALNDEFAVTSKQVFHSEVQNIDFSASKTSAKEINEWVEAHTNKNIKDLVDPNSITVDTQAILVNAIYFKGNWKSKFSEDSTRDRDFHVTSEKTIKIPMMYQSSDFKYGVSEELDAKILELPYKGDETSLVIVLPNKIDGINDLVKKLKDPSLLNDALQHSYIQEVEVSLPKFKIETTINLKEALSNMGIKKLFGNEARLDRLLKGASNLYISDATQKAFIEVNERGSEAAAANQFIMMLGSSPYPVKREHFTADHSFMFFILEKNVILFSGVFRS